MTYSEILETEIKKIIDFSTDHECVLTSDLRSFAASIRQATLDEFEKKITDEIAKLIDPYEYRGSKDMQLAKDQTVNLIKAILRQQLAAMRKEDK